MDITANIEHYLSGHGASGGVQPMERYASFDYCYNYFQTFREQERISQLAAPEHLHASCLQLGFYLASWGMLRGSSFLLGKSARFYGPVIETISTFDSRIWDIDVDRYTDTTISLLLASKEALATALGRANRPSDVLVTKIMLGVFGNVPAFDTYFRRGFGLSAFSARSLASVAKFYQEHQAELDSYRITTLDFTTGQPTARRYPLAKLIDMVGFIEGSLGETAAPESLIRD